MHQRLNKKWSRYALIGALGIGMPLVTALSSAAIAGGQKTLRVLSAIDPGSWQFRSLDRSASAWAPRNICVGKDARTISILHGGNGSCELFVTEDTAKQATLTYSCAGGDQGLTRVRMETSKLMVVETQGIKDSKPFHARYEARYKSGC